MASTVCAAVIFNNLSQQRARQSSYRKLVLLSLGNIACIGMRKNADDIGGDRRDGSGQILDRTWFIDLEQGDAGRYLVFETACSEAIVFAKRKC